MLLSHGCCGILLITEAGSRTRAMKPYGSGATLSFCALSSSLTFALALLCSFPWFVHYPYLSRAFGLPWWRRTMSSVLISRAGSWWSTLDFQLRSLLTLRLVLCHPQTQYPSAQQLFKIIKVSSALAIYKRFDFFPIRGHEVL